MPDVVFNIKDSCGTSVPRADVIVAYPDGRYLTGQSDAEGKCQLYLYRTDCEMKVLVAAEGYSPFHNIVLPGEQATINLELEPAENGCKAIVFTKRTGFIPGISGRLNPHKDGYVYGENIAINGRLATPAAHFKIGESLHLIDVYGVETTIRFLVVEGQFSLIEYTEPRSYQSE